MASVNASKDVELAGHREAKAKTDAALVKAREDANRLVELVIAAKDSSLLLAKLKEAEARIAALEGESLTHRTAVEAIETRILEGEAVADGYRALAAYLDRAIAIDDREMLRGLVRGSVKVIEWRQAEGEIKRGEAKIELFELAPGWIDGLKSERPGEPSFGSPSRPLWRGVRDSNPWPPA